MFRDIADGKPVMLNKEINQQEKESRIQKFYTPYHKELQYLGSIIKPALILSIHSFTPEYEGQKRTVEIGVLYNVHEQPAKLLNDHLCKLGYESRLNEPWSGKEGFMYAASSLQNDTTRKALMLEFRQDLLIQETWREKMVQHLASFFVKNSHLYME